MIARLGISGNDDMRLAVIYIGQETNDFNPVLTTLADYAAFGLLDGPAMFETLKGIGQVGGHLDACAASGRDVESVPITYGWAVAGGRITTEARLYFEERIRTGLKQAGRIDGLHLQLHGACSAEGIDDVEGTQIALCRDILGPDLPIVLGLDHHANVTEAMVRHATAIVAHRTQPHDIHDTGVIGADILMRIVAGEVKRPVIAFRKLRMTTHQEQFLTAHGPMKLWFDRARAIEAADPRVLHCGLFPMQPWLDVAEGGWAVTVSVDGDRALAERLADELADMAWSMREDFMVREAVPIDEAVRLADQETKPGVVVLSDTGDTVFGGSAGDSNLILESILRQGIKGRALIPLIAPPTARRLAEAGAGATVTLKVGGESTPFFTPLEVTGVVRKVADGRIALPEHGYPDVDMGRTVIFEVGPVTLMVSEGRGVAGNMPGAYRAFGIEPKDYAMAVLKTASNFQFFAPITSRVIRADTMGPGQSDVLTLPWKRLPRPMFPLDPIGSWKG